MEVSEDGVVSDLGYTHDESITQLMSGVPYGAPITAALTDYAEATGQGAAKMLDTLQNNADRFGSGDNDWNSLKITFKPNGTDGEGKAKYEVKTYVVSGQTETLLYDNGDVTHGTGGSAGNRLSDVAPANRKLRLQTHWDSGIKLRNVMIGDPPA